MGRRRGATLSRIIPAVITRRRRHPSCRPIGPSGLRTETSMEYGVVIPSQGHFGDPGAIRAFITAAEQLDFHTAWLGDHVIIPSYAAHLSPPNWYDSLATSLVGTGMTTRLRFSPDVLVLPYRNPVEHAHVVATADQLSGGRITLATGIGYIRGEFAALGAPPYEERGKVTTEYLRCCARCGPPTGRCRSTGATSTSTTSGPGRSRCRIRSRSWSAATSRSRRSPERRSKATAGTRCSRLPDRVPGRARTHPRGSGRGLGSPSPSRSP